MHFFNKHSNCQRLQLSKSKEVCLTQQIAHLSVSWKSCISMVDFDETCLIKSKCSLRNANLKYNRASLHSWLFWPVFYHSKTYLEGSIYSEFKNILSRWLFNLWNYDERVKVTCICNQEFMKMQMHIKVICIFFTFDFLLAISTIPINQLESNRKNITIALWSNCEQL